MKALFTEIWQTHVEKFAGNPAAPSHREAILALGEPRLRTRRCHVHTIADPFLLSHGGRLWLFVEEMRWFGRGKICAYSTDNLRDWINHGVVLSENTHLSYPQVFEHAGSVWMVPESAEAGCVWLYHCERLPGPWRRKTRLLEKPHWDPTLLHHEGRWYMWATDGQSALRLFHSDALEGPYLEHAASPVTSDRRASRCGGMPILLPGGQLVRLAQDCSVTYGRGLGFYQIEHISPESYQEREFARDVLPRDSEWNRHGTHHLSVANFSGTLVRALDGRSADCALNLFPRVFWRLVSMARLAHSDSHGR